MNHGHGSGRPWQREPREGPDPQEKQVPLLGRVSRGGVDHHRNLPAPEHVHACGLSEGGAALAEAMSGKNPLANLGETGHFLCRLLVSWYLLCGLKASGG